MLYIIGACDLRNNETQFRKQFTLHVKLYFTNSLHYKSI